MNISGYMSMWALDATIKELRGLGIIKDEGNCK